MTYQLLTSQLLLIVFSSFTFFVGKTWEISRFAKESCNLLKKYKPTKLQEYQNIEQQNNKRNLINILLT